MRDTLLSEELRPSVRRTPAEIEEFLGTLERASLLVPGTTEFRVCRGLDDDTFFTAALEGAAEYIVSGDLDLLAVRRYRGATVLSPADFLQVLSHDSS